MNQTYELIPEPAGDWQEGDWTPNACVDNRYRARPVKAQAGQLWRTVADTDTWINGDRFIPEDGKWVRPVPATCACEGLREAARKAMAWISGPEQLQVWEDLYKALAQSCPCQQSGEQPISENLSGGVESRHASHADKTQNAAVSPILDSKTETSGPASSSGSSAPPAHFSPAAASEAQDAPRTDAAIWRTESGTGVVWPRLARQLERELNQAYATVAALRRELESWRGENLDAIKSSGLPDCTSAVGAVQELRRELEEAKERVEHWVALEAAQRARANQVEADRDPMARQRQTLGGN